MGELHTALLPPAQPALLLSPGLPIEGWYHPRGLGPPMLPVNQEGLTNLL